MNCGIRKWGPERAHKDRHTQVINDSGRRCEQLEEGVVVSTECIQWSSSVQGFSRPGGWPRPD